MPLKTEMAGFSACRQGFRGLRREGVEKNWARLHKGDCEPYPSAAELKSSSRRIRNSRRKPDRDRGRRQNGGRTPGAPITRAISPAPSISVFGDVASTSPTKRPISTPPISKRTKKNSSIFLESTKRGEGRRRRRPWPTRIISTRRRWAAQPGHLHRPALADGHATKGEEALDTAPAGAQNS